MKKMNQTPKLGLEPTMWDKYYFPQAMERIKKKENPTLTFIEPNLAQIYLGEIFKATELWLTWEAQSFCFNSPIVRR